MRIIENLTPYSKEEIFSLAKRENNTKRTGLIVNLMQAKHVPALPSKTLELFDLLAEQIDRSSKKTLVIGFAETATAIGAEIAVKLGCEYIHTTRENFPIDMRLADFSEEHSHATEQNLFSDRADFFDGIERIIFAEDELTTGKTILNFISVLSPLVRCEFEAASIINGMSRENLDTFAEKNIKLHWLIKLDSSLKKLSEDFEITPEKDVLPSDDFGEVTDLSVVFSKNPRLCVNAAEFKNDCDKLADMILKMCGGADRIDVIGTQEFMYPSIIAAKKLEDIGSVTCHSTTRSPIVPSKNENYPLNLRCTVKSLYSADRMVHLYNMPQCDLSIVITDAQNFSAQTKSEFLSVLRSPKKLFVTVKYENEKPQDECFMRSSYKSDDVKILLKDITGLVEPLPASKREPLIQSGTHYCQMLPLEYVPSKKYINEYENALKLFSQITADSAAVCAEKIYKDKPKPVLVSLARAGLPAGIIIKHYLEKKYKIDVPHYAVSIIRGRGIDKNAMNFILARHKAESVQFVDGWTGKGAIQNQVSVAMRDFKGVDERLAVLSDPAYITKFCGTHDDFLIASSCLNSTVSGLISRTFLRDDIIGENDFHGAAYYGELKAADRSYEFIEAVEKCMRYDLQPTDDEFAYGAGRAEVEAAAEAFDISDINLVKPGIGEATRVLLRRVPYKILIAQNCEEKYIRHILALAEEKGVPVETFPLKCYRACGIIKNMPADT